MNLRASLVAAALACAGPLAAQDIPHGPHLLQVVASSGGVVLSVDSSTVVRTGESSFLADAIYQFPADTAQHVGADRQVESQEMDCAGMRIRGRTTSHYLAGSVVPVTSTNGTYPWSTQRWEAVGEDELPIIQVLCQFLAGSFAAMPVTREAGSVDTPPELLNGHDVAREMSRQYPRAARDAGIGGQAIVRLQITPEGRADSLRTIWATRDDFAATAMRVIRNMRFRPAKDHGNPVTVWVTMPVTFSLFDEGTVEVPVPERGPPGSPAWGGRSANPTRPLHPDPRPGLPD
jgi:TonB family protein